MEQVDFFRSQHTRHTVHFSYLFPDLICSRKQTCHYCHRIKSISQQMSPRIEVLTPLEEVYILIGFVGCLASITTVIVLSAHLLHFFCYKAKTVALNKPILIWQLMGFVWFFISCLFYAFIRNNLVYGGKNNLFNYNPNVIEPYGWITMFAGYFLGKLCTDISWIIRVYDTFNVE